MRKINPKSVLLAGIAMVASSLLVACGTEHATDNNNDGQQPGGTAGSSQYGSTTSGQDADPSGPSSNQEAGVVNYVDNRAGVQIFGTAKFGAITNGAPDHAPFGAKLVVTCYVPNTTGSYGSVNGLYRIKGGKWDGNYVPANVMLNDPLAKIGSTDTPSIDPRLEDVICS